MSMLLGWFSVLAQASCGLDQCPMPTAARGLGAQVGARIDLAGAHTDVAEGTWARTTLVGAVRPVPAVALTAAVPVQMQVAAGSVRTGLGNALFGAEALPASGRWRPLAGAQLEVPVGGSAVAEHHWGALPYAGLRFVPSAVWIDARTGLRTAIDAVAHGTPTAAAASPARATLDHEEPPVTPAPQGGAEEHVVLVAVPLLIDPHEHLEVVSRLAVGRSGDWSPSGALDVVRVLGGTGPRWAVDASAALGRVVTPRVRVTGVARVPLLRPGRFDWWTGAEVTATFGR
ncbi:MAG: hypothetical protein R3F59_33700 [Myxococcota bacterium]